MPVYNAASDVHHPQHGHRLERIPARDRFVLTDERNRMYYLYTGGTPEWNGMDRYRCLSTEAPIFRSGKVRLSSFHRPSRMPD
ncbi:hypothetical protein [Paenibacillus sp. Z6-24]